MRYGFRTIRSNGGPFGSMRDIRRHPLQPWNRSDRIWNIDSGERAMSDLAELKTLTSEQISTITRQTNYGTWRFQKTWNPLHIADAEGCWFTDGAGKRYLDLSAQLMCVNLGHKNPAVIAAIAEQAEALAYAMPTYATEARAELSQLLLEVLPEGLTKFFFTTSVTG